MSKFPIDEYLETIESKAEETGTVILKAEPGVGKTTRVPAYLLNKNKKILVIEPRRVAAILPATFIAEQLGEEVGNRVGYKVRFDQKLSANTALTFMTDGMAVKMLSNENFISKFDYIIFDEFHERSLNTDLAIAIAEHYRNSASSSKLKIIIMSATLDVEALESIYHESKPIDIKGRPFPVDNQYIPREEKETIESHVVRAVKSSLTHPDNSGNILIFLTGRNDIEKVSKALQGADLPLCEVITFMSSNAGENLKKINRENGLRKVICSTNVAETSVTLPNITCVIDGGEQFQEFFATWNGLPFIKRVKISQDSAIQRAGRAGRLSKGLCIKLYTESDYLGRNRFNLPDVEKSDLTAFILDGMICTGIGNANQFCDSLKFITIPPEEAVTTAISTLQLIGFLDEKSNITNEAIEASKLPLHPRLASVFLKAKKLGVSGIGAYLCGLVEEGGVFPRRSKARIHHDSDYTYQIEAIHYKLSGKSNDFEVKHIIETKLKSIIFLAEKLGFSKLESTQINSSVINKLLLSGFPDRVARILPKFKLKQDQARKKGEMFLGGQYLFTLGRSALLPQESSVQGKDLLLSPSSREHNERGTSKIFMDLVTSLEASDLIESGSQLLRTAIEIEQTDKGNVIKKEKTFYGEILVDEKTLEASSDELSSIIKDSVLQNFPKGFTDEHLISVYHSKLNVLDKNNIEHDLPRIEGEFLELVADVITEGKSSLDEVYQKSLKEYLLEIFSYEDDMLLKSLCPDFIKLDNGNKMAVKWDDHGPSVSDKIQMFYGLKSQIEIGSRKLGAKIILLAPNMRPAQVTSDITGFFNRGYAELAKELKRKYPKHYWPEDPEGSKPHLLKRHAET